MRYQMIDLQLERTYSLAEFTEIANADTCIIGVHLNRAIGASSLPTDPLVATRQADDFNSMSAANAYAKLFGTNAISPGTDVIVGVVDSGIRHLDSTYQTQLNDALIEIYNTHPDLAANLWNGPSGQVGTWIGPAASVGPFGSYPIDMGIAYRSNLTAQYERTFHGTHVAGTIAAVSNNGIGGAGVAGRVAKIMSVKVTSSRVIRAVRIDNGSSSTLRDITNGILWAVDPTGKPGGRIAEVINISMGTSPINKAAVPLGFDSAFRSALGTAVSRGVVVAVSAGNNSLPLDQFTVLPASLGSEINGVMTVGAFNSKTGQWAGFSNYGGMSVELAAPGVDVLSAIREDEDDPSRPNHPENTVGYGILSGTSMASPQVAGAMALAIAYLKSRGVTYTAADIEQLVKVSGRRSTGFTHFGPTVMHSTQNRALDLDNLADNLIRFAAGQPIVVSGSSRSGVIRANSSESRIQQEASQVSFGACP
jgi:serine protease